MGAVDLGAAVTVTWSTAPAGGMYTVATTAPDGTTGPAPTPVGTPPEATFIPTMPGRWLVRWISTGVADSYTDVVDVWPADPLFIISLDDAKSALNMTGPTPPGVLDDLRLYIAAATPVIEDIVGPVVHRVVTQRGNGGGNSMVLTSIPNSVVSVTAGGVTVLPGGYTPSLAAGVIYAGGPNTRGVFAGGNDELVVVYTAGYQVIPPNIRLATRELVRHLWQLGKQSNRGAGAPNTGDAWTPSGFAVPRRVIELCAPHIQGCGFA